MNTFNVTLIHLSIGLTTLYIILCMNPLNSRPRSLRGYVPYSSCVGGAA